MHTIKGSSSIIGIDARGDDLRIRFTSGAEYDYKGVGQDMINEMLTSDSVGKFFAQKIRPHFEGVKADPEGDDDGDEKDNQESQQEAGQ